MYFDDDWQRINDETDNNGDRQKPLFARHVRTEGGMIIGRVVKNSDSTEFEAQKFKYGHFVTLGKSTSFDETYRMIQND